MSIDSWSSLEFRGVGPDQEARREALAQELGKVARHEKLTYGDIVALQPSVESPDLPAGFVKSDDPLAELVLQEFHLKFLKQNLATGARRPLPTHLAGFEVQEMQDVYPDEFARYVHPTVEGYGWYRGLMVDPSDTSSVLVLVPWMQPWYEGGSPFPTLYVEGDPSPDQVQAVAIDFSIASMGNVPVV